MVLMDMSERIENIRNSLMKTKPHEVWQEDIVFLCQYLINRYYDYVLDEPNGWEGFKEVKTDEFTLHEQGKTWTCQHLSIDEHKNWSVKTASGGNIPIRRIRIIASYVEITKALLLAIDKLPSLED
jgi:hypothetical protein